MEEKTKTQQSLRKPRENSHFSPSSSSCNLYLSRAPVSVSFIFHFPDLCPEILPVLADNPGLRNGTLFRPASPFVVTSHQRNTNNFSEHYFTFPQLFFSSSLSFASSNLPHFPWAWSPVCHHCCRHSCQWQGCQQTFRIVLDCGFCGIFSWPCGGCWGCGWGMGW